MKKYNFGELNRVQIEKLCRRPAINFENVFKTVRVILDDIKRNGDNAVKKYTQKFNNITLESFLVSEQEINEACQKIPENVKKAFQQAAKNIKKFHKFEMEMSSNKKIETMPGVECFYKYRPIEKVGLYIPGGTAPLPSTVLMLGIPAKMAGCREIILCAPPNQEGKIPDIVLYAAKLVGVTKIFKIGGAQAIAAMGYGTKSVPKVFKICGPGNQYVTAAKMLLSIEPEGPSIDLPAGPSEVLVIADKNANADFVASDLLSQSEHGPDSQVILLSTDDKKIDEVFTAVERQLKNLPRKAIAEKALKNSLAINCPNIESAIKFANLYAPEHLILNIQNPEKYLGKILSAGSVFLGPYSCESAGDYASGTNHTLPTYGYAKSYSGVSTFSFMKRITFQKLSPQGIKNLGQIVETMAETEGLQAHKNAMTLRINSLNQ